MAHKKIDTLLAVVTRRLKEAFEGHVMPHAIDTEIAAIGMFVYDVYPSPYMYERRGESGGLADRDHFKIRGINGQIKYTLANETPGKNQKDINIAELVYGGDGYKGMKYDYPDESRRGQRRYTYLRPRDFITPTAEALRTTTKDVVVSALEGQGLRIK